MVILKRGRKASVSDECRCKPNYNTLCEYIMRIGGTQTITRNEEMRKYAGRVGRVRRSQSGSPFAQVYEHHNYSSKFKYVLGFARSAHFANHAVPRCTTLYHAYARTRVNN